MRHCRYSLQRFAPVETKPEARNDKRDNTAVTDPESKKRQTGKLGSDHRENTESAKGRIIKDSDYPQFPIGNDYHNTPGRTGQAAVAADVGGVPAAQEGTPADAAGKRFDGLVYPQHFSSLKAQSRKLFDKLLPAADSETLQEILDEIAGQTKPVTSPLGLLTVLCRKAAAGELLCILAPLVREKRERQQAWEKQRLEQEQRLQKQAAAAAGNDAARANSEDLRRSVLHAVGIRPAESSN